MKEETVMSKLDEIRNGSMRWWGARSDQGRHRLTVSIDRLAEQMRKRYGYTRDKAELEVSELLRRVEGLEGTIAGLAAQLASSGGQGGGRAEPTASRS